MGEYETTEMRIRRLEMRKKEIEAEINSLMEELIDVNNMIGENRAYLAELKSIDGEDE